MNVRHQAATGRLDAVLAGVFLWIEAFLIWPDLLFSQGGWLGHLGLLLAAHGLVGDRAWGTRLKRWTAWVFCAVWAGAFLAWSVPTQGAHHGVFYIAAALWWYACWRIEPQSQSAPIPPPVPTTTGS